MGSPRVLVVGAGGLGGVIAAHLRRGGLDVPSLVRPGPVAEALASRGLVVDDLGVRLQVPARPLVSLDGEGPFDLAVLATQPTHVEAAARQVLPALADDGALVLLQNGLCEPRVAAIAGEERVIGAVVSWGADVDGPGHVRRTSKGRFTLGRWDGRSDPRVEAAAAVLGAVAPARITANLRGARWSKLAFNCAISTLGTLGGDRVGPLVAQRFVRDLALEIMTEAVAVARAEGVRLEKLAGTVDLEWLALPDAAGPVARGVRDAVVRLVGLQIRHLRSSMLRALERGEEPPVDWLNGEIVAAAARHGLAAARNAAAVEAVRRLARGEQAPGVAVLRDLYATTRSARTP